MPIQLVVVEGPEAGREFLFNGHENFIVGRGEEAHFRLSREDRHCSRLHFMIEVNPPLCQVLDLESNNGTAVNGTKITKRVRLKDGDQIKAGRTLLRVHIIPEAVPVASTESQGSVPPAGPSPVTLIDVEPIPLAVVVPPAASPPSPARPVPPPLPVSPPVPSASLPALAGFRFDAEIGRGSLGKVYRAVRLADQVPMAIKYIQPGRQDAAARKRFIRDVQTLKNLDHPRVVRTHIIGSQGDLLVFIMEYVDGMPLADLGKQHGVLPVPFAVGLTSQILEGLEVGHRQNWVHRDLKPSNVLLSKTPTGKFGVKLADFGLARVFQASPLSGLSISEEDGGPLMLHAAPEVLTNAKVAEKASDQYSTAVILYELLTGRLPYPLAKSHAQVYSNILLKPPTPAREFRPEVPAGVEAVLARALEKKPEKRFPSLEAFWKALKPFSGG